MLDRLRGSLGAFLGSLGRGASRLLPNPTAWTLIGLLLASLAAFYYSGGRAFLGGLFLAASGALDVLDGAVARASGRTSQLGAFLDSTLDRVSELLVFLGILLGHLADPSLVLLALSLSLLVSYARAKGDSLGVNLAGMGVGERSERLLVLIAASLLGLVGYGVMLVALLAFVTFVQRAAAVSRRLTQRRDGAAPSPQPARAVSSSSVSRTLPLRSLSRSARNS